MLDNPEFAKAWKIVSDTNVSLFLTGKAGTGKTTFLRNLKKELHKRLVVCAPTGIAAINAEGVTLHSMFQLPFTPFIPEATFSMHNKKYAFSKQKVMLIRSIDLLVIDEISMVRADLLDAVDSVLRQYRDRTQPFGGVQLLLIGDLQQLSPVAKSEEWDLLKEYYETPYFFSSKALQQLPYFTIELRHVYRQQDAQFIDLLNKVREGIVNREVLDALNQRYLPNFSPKAEEGYIRLTSHNKQADRINQEQLECIDNKLHTYHATIEGDFPEVSFPTDHVLQLKKKAQVMFVRNDAEHRYYNGMIGEVVEVLNDSVKVRPYGHKNDIVVESCLWENNKYVIDADTKEISEEIIGTFKQLPLRLAWAITIHKSQGLTFDKAIIDARYCFASGQTYVALSRCRTFEGLILSSPLQTSSIFTDKDVDNYHKELAHRSPTSEQLQILSRNYFAHVAKSIFDFNKLQNRFATLHRIIEEHFYKLYPHLLNDYRNEAEFLTKKVVEVGTTFNRQIDAILSDSDIDYANSEYLQQRMKKASEYFSENLVPLTVLLNKNIPELDNKQIEKTYINAKDALCSELKTTIKLLKHIGSEGFDLHRFLRLKSDVMNADNEIDKEEKKSSKKAAVSKPEELSEDILHPEVYDALRAWRKTQASQLHIAPYMVFSQRALLELSNRLPQNEKELLAVPYIGKTIVEKYGADILKIIATH